jgi:hypothetical protein
MSVHVTWGGDYYCYLVVNICTNWTHACQLNAGILSVGIKWRTLLFELSLYLKVFRWNNVLKTLQIVAHHKSNSILSYRSKAIPLHAMQALRGREVIYSFLISALDRGEWSVLCLGRTLPPRKDSSHWIGWWVGLRAGLDTEARRKRLCLWPGSNPAVQSVVRLYTDLSHPSCFPISYAVHKTSAATNIIN